MSVFTVIKCDHTGREVLRYTGTRLAGGPEWVCVRALFQFADRDLGYVTLHQGDIFTEWFYTDRWYNVFRVEDGRHGHLKGWYCNLTRPARLLPAAVAADDLALDVFVRPDRSLLLLDEAEYAALHLPPHEQQAVAAALTDIRTQAAAGSGPFAHPLPPGAP